MRLAQQVSAKIREIADRVIYGLELTRRNQGVGAQIPTARFASRTRKAIVQPSIGNPLHLHNATSQMLVRTLVFALMALSCEQMVAPGVQAPGGLCKPASQPTQEVGCWILADDPMGRSAGPRCSGISICIPRTLRQKLTKVDVEWLWSL